MSAKGPNGIGTLVLDNHHRPVFFDQPPATEKMTYNDMIRLVNELKARYNLRMEESISFVLNEIKKLQRIEEYPVILLKSFVKFQVSRLNGEYTPVSYLARIPDDAQLSKEEWDDLKRKLEEDYPFIDEIKDIPMSKEKILERKKEILNIFYYIVETEKRNNPILHGKI